MFARSIGGVVLATLAACWSLPAAAQIAGETTYYAPNPRVLTIPVIATIGGHCGFTGAGPSGTYDAGTIDVSSWSNNFTFTLDCTGPSRVAVVSTNGGLLSATPPFASGYTNLAPYSVTLNLVGSSTTASQTCAVSTLTSTAGAPCTFRGPASTTQGLHLTSPSVGLSGSYVQVSAPAFPGPDVLVNGNYSDTLTVTVSAAI